MYVYTREVSPSRLTFDVFMIHFDTPIHDSLVEFNFKTIFCVLPVFLFCAIFVHPRNKTTPNMMGMNQNPHSLHFLICPFFLFRTIYSFLKQTKTPQTILDPKQIPSSFQKQVVLLMAEIPFPTTWDGAKSL